MDIFLFCIFLFCITIDILNYCLFSSLLVFFITLIICCLCLHCCLFLLSVLEAPNTKTNSLCVQTHLAIKLFLILILTYQTCTHIIVYIIYCVFAILYIAYLYIILLLSVSCPVAVILLHSGASVTITNSSYV